MLERLLIKDFQTHSKTTIEFDQITCIIGESDTGKSSVLRALRWLCLNDRRGLGFVGKWGKAKQALVKLTVDNHVIARKKGKGINEYWLDGSILGFGIGESGKVPDSIAKILSLSSLNFSNQHSQPFWFSETAGKVSRELNAVVDLGVIDSTLANVNSEVRKARSEKAVCEKRLQEAKVEKQQLAWVPGFNADLERLEELHQELVRKVKVGELLGNLLEQVKNARKLASQEVPDISKLAELVKRYKQLNEKRIAIAILLNIIKMTRKQIQDLAKEIHQLQRELGKIEKCPVCRRPL